MTVEDETPPIEIRAEDWRIVRAILQEFVPDREVWVFGSRAKRTAKPYSDLDLVIVGNQPLSLETSALLSEAFSESDLPWKVDVLDWATTKESFRAMIEADRVVAQAGPKPDAAGDRPATV